MVFPGGGFLLLGRLSAACLHNLGTGPLVSQPGALLTLPIMGYFPLFAKKSTLYTTKVSVAFLDFTDHAMQTTEEMNGVQTNALANCRPAVWRKPSLSPSEASSLPRYTTRPQRDRPVGGTSPPRPSYPGSYPP